MAAVAFKRIHVEEMVGGKGDAVDGAVVHRALKHVDVFRVALQRIHTLIPEAHTHRGAGLAVGFLVGKVVVVGESFGVVHVADSAGGIHFGAGNLVPHPVERCQIGSVAGCGCHIGHAGELIHSPYAVAGDIGELRGRHHIHIVLGRETAIRPVAVAPAALLQKPAREVEIALLACDTVELYQRQLDFLMAGHPIALARTESAVEIVGEADGHIKELALAGGFVICHGRLHKVSGAIHLVAVHIGPAAVGLHEGVVGVEISVGLLCGCHGVDNEVEAALQLLVGMIDESVGAPFNHLVEIGIVVENAFEFSFLQPCGYGEILYALGRFLALSEAGRDGHCGVLVQQRQPERIVDFHLREIHRSVFLQVRYSFLRGGCIAGHRRRGCGDDGDTGYEEFLKHYSCVFYSRKCCRSRLCQNSHRFVNIGFDTTSMG